MSTLINEKTQFTLNSQNLSLYLKQIAEKLQGRVDAAYVFGSASSEGFTDESDIDLILIQNCNTKAFVQRAFDFIDLFSIYPKLDILVYTQNELDQQLADSEIGFWKSVRLSMKKIV